ncbi:MAG TPA: aldehyde dehydrogenase family protein, partial [Tepidisphaeraceae bacterium]|nr:aldehyde dehydrogenase family protein [Tepidisphaeraceae bacterium]
MRDVHPIFLAGRWIASTARASFDATNPGTGQSIPGAFPISPWSEIDTALTAAVEAFERIADDITGRCDFLDRYARLIEAGVSELAAIAHDETGLPVHPRLIEQELPRTIRQLRDSAAAARDGAWALPTVDETHNLVSMHRPIGPVVVFGPNNFPFAYNGIVGGDFAAALPGGKPGIAPVDPPLPPTTAPLPPLPRQTPPDAGLHPASVQLIYHMSNDDGLKLVADRRVGAVGFTGSRAGGLALKRAADEAGIPIYLEMSSVNPVVMLPGALADRCDALADQFTTSSLLAAGQFCTNPGLVFLIGSSDAERFVARAVETFRAAEPQTMLSRGTVESLDRAVRQMRQSNGVELLVGGQVVPGARCAYRPTLLRTIGQTFLDDAEQKQSEMFGSAALLVFCESIDQLRDCLRQLDGQLTGSICVGSGDDEAYEKIEPILRRRVGRLLNDQMPTGVAVSPAMQHGGPFPATGHPGFTAVGPPATLRRF